MSQTQTQQPISIYIPRVFSNLDAEFIKSIFEKLNLGRVRHVDLVPRQNPVEEFGGVISVENSTPNMAFVHFWEWGDNAASLNFQEKVLDSTREARIVYDDPWYWIVLENRNPKSDAQLVTEQKLADAEQKIDELEHRVLRLESEIYGDNVPDGFEVITDDDGTEYIVEIDDDQMDQMPQRQNGEDGAEAEPRMPLCEPNSSLGEEYDRMLENPTAMIGSLSINDNSGVETTETPEWLDNATDATLSWQELHQQAEKFRKQFSVEDGGGGGFVPRHPTECPSIDLPLRVGRIAQDTMTGEYFIYSIVNGEHTWTPTTKPTIEWLAANPPPQEGGGC